MELIVVMIISALVISITYKCFDIISWQYLSYKKNNEEINGILALDVLLTKDISNSKYIKTVDNGIECSFKERKVVYEWNENYILRGENSVIDTFKINPKDLTFGFLGQEVVSSGMYINHLSFTNSFKEVEQLFIYKKAYSADFLMQSQVTNESD